jgi:RNA polymerase sigma-70 factor (ECF subfamily)
MDHDDSSPGVHFNDVQTAYASVRSASAQISSGRAPVLEAVAANDRDRTLIAAIAAGDEVAFNEIHARYYRRIANFTRRITRCSELTAEITNDTLWAIWRCAPRFKGSSKVSTWILGIAYHIGRKTLQRTSRHEACEGLMRGFVTATHEPCAEGDDREWIGAALVQLSVDQRTVLELFYHFGHSCEEIAERVNCPANTVKTRMHHGRRKLRQLLSRLAGFETG